MNIECKMPTKAYLRKFAYWLENIPSTTEPIISTKSNSIVANLIKLHLVGKKELVEKDYNWIYKDYPDSLAFRVFDYSIDRGKIFLSRKSIYVINKALHDLFLEIALCRAVFQKRIGLDYRDSLRDFCEEIGIEIEIDIAFQTLIKQFYRYKKNKKDSYFDGGSCPSKRKTMLV